ncbi:hypothetical protein FOZ61_004452, partial [Perkinsus olseni]
HSMAGKRSLKAKANHRRRQRARKSDAGPIALSKLQELRQMGGQHHENGSGDRLYYTSTKLDAKSLEVFPVAGDHKDHLEAALKREHPLDTGITLPIALEAAIEAQLSLDPDELVRRRQLGIEAIKRRAKALEEATSAARASMHPDVAKISGNLNLELLEELIELTEYPDKALVEDLRNGMPVVGHIEVAPGVFAPKDGPGDSDGAVNIIPLDELLRKAKSSRDNVISSICREGFKPEVWEATLQE